MHSKKAIFFIYFLVSLYSYLFFANFSLKSDEIIYYALTEAIYNHKLSLENEVYLDNYLIKRPLGLPHSDKLKLSSPYSPVSALIYYPFFAFFDSLKDFNFFRFNDLLFSPLHKVPFRRFLSIWIPNLFFLFFTFILIHFILKKIYGLNDLLLLLINLFIFFGTPWLCYSTFYFFFLHNLEIFLASLFLFLWLKKDFNSYGYFLLLSFIFTFLIGIRYINIAVFIIPFSYSLYHSKLAEKKLNSITKACLISFIGSLPIILFISYYNYNILGSLIATGYSSDLFLINQSFVESSIAVLKRIVFYYFHPLRGLFIWHPLFLLSFFGFFLPSSNKELKYLILASLLLLTIALSFYVVWWAGNSFGQRYMLITIPFYAIGLANILNKTQKKFWIICLLSLLYSLFLYILYLGNANKGQGENFTPSSMINYAVEYPQEVIKAFKNNTINNKLNPFQLFLRAYNPARPVKLYKVVSFSSKKVIRIPLDSCSKKLMFVFQLYLNKNRKFPNDLLFVFYTDSKELNKKNNYLTLSDLGFPSPFLRISINEQDLKLYGWINENNFFSEAQDILIFGVGLDLNNYKIVSYYEINMKGQFKAYDGIAVKKALMYDSLSTDNNKYIIKAVDSSNIFLFWQAKGNSPFLIEKFTLKKNETAIIPKGIKSLSRQYFKGILWILSDGKIEFVNEKI